MNTEYSGADFIIPITYTTLTKDQLEQMVTQDDSSWDKQALKKLLDRKS